MTKNELKDFDLEGYVREELQKRKGQWGGIAEAADVSYSWLTKFADNEDKKSWIQLVQAVARVLDQFPPTAAANSAQKKRKKEKL